jgi:NAD-dependent dihydropyrimidine dehydrogenase PreA subunit
MKQTEVSDPKFAKWKGVPRKEIKWNPNIDEKKCIGCGMCITSCNRNVFDFDKEKNKSVVARPNNCMVGCTSCETWCIFNAISFPDKQYVKNLIKEKGLLKVAKKELEEKLNPKHSSCTG